MKILILYIEHRISERIAIVTQSQGKKNGINIDILNINDSNLLSKLTAIDEDLLVYSPYDIPLFSEYFSENIDIFMEKVAGPSLYTKKLFLYNIEEVRIENNEASDEKTAYKYVMIDKIKNDIKVIKNKCDVSILNKDELRIETLREDMYWIENYLYFHENCEAIQNKEEAKSKMKAIAKERRRNLLTEINRVEQNYKNHMVQIENELKMVEKRLADLE